MKLLFCGVLLPEFFQKSTKHSCIVYVLLWIPIRRHVCANQPAKSYIWTPDAVYRTSQERWTIGTDAERKSQKSTISARLEDDNDEDDYDKLWMISVLMLFFKNLNLSWALIRTQHYYDYCLVNFSHQLVVFYSSLSISKSP